MRNFSVVLSAAVAGMILSSGAEVSAAETPSCSVVERRLVCAGGSRHSTKVARAMANPETIENLNNAERGDRLLADPVERELFRRSVERARRKIKFYADKHQRRFNRGRLPKATMDEVRDIYANGLKSYHVAMGLFHSTEWYSKTPDEKAEGNELTSQ